jgi:hypothetical protein
VTLSEDGGTNSVNVVSEGEDQPFEASVMGSVRDELMCERTGVMRAG